MAYKTVHIIGAGVAGLAAAVKLVSLKKKEDINIVLHEASSHAGGRCFSFYDNEFGCMLDNGTHMLIGSNKNAFNYLEIINSKDLFVPVEPAIFPFVDVATTKGWMIKPGGRFLPLWLLASSRRVPNSKLLSYLKALKLKRAHPESTVKDILCKDENLYKNLWEPLCVATMNTPADVASANLFWRVVADSVMKGKKSIQPYLAKKSLKAALVEPAIDYLTQNDVDIKFGHKLEGLGIEHEVRELVFQNDEAITLKESDKVILATPAHHTADLLPTVHLPYIFRPIINVHFKVDDKFKLPGNVPFTGVVNGVAQWIFHKGNIASVTVSAADDLMKLTPLDIARRAWVDICTVRRKTGIPIPQFKIIKEKRATIDHSPAMENLRKPAKSKLENLIIAGDWTQTGLPCTIEGAITSGYTAAELSMQNLK